MHGRVIGPQGPLSDVAVSNTVEVVKTDDQGKFSLPERAGFVMVSVPAGFRCEKWWRSVREAGEFGERGVEFALEPTQSELPYKFVHLTDLHLSVKESGKHEAGGKKRALYEEGSTPEEIETVLTAIEASSPQVDAIFVTGDLVDRGTEEEFSALKRALDGHKSEIRVIPGNHDHMAGTNESVVSPNNYLTNAAYPENYETHMGPRWHSFDIPGLHVVSLDWLTFELGIDATRQLEWLKQDLAQIPDDMPWALLFHDQPSSTLLDHVPRLPVATFSGHWHTSRIVEVDDVLHVNTPPVFFGGLDYSPPMLRFITWDGTDFEIDSVVTWQDPTHSEPDPLLRKATIRPSGVEAAREFSWQIETSGAGHLQSPVVDGYRAFIGTQFEDGVSGAVEAFHIADGGRIWRHQTKSAVKSTLALAQNQVIYHEVTGDVVALDADSGEVRWRVPSSDPLRRFAWGSPATDGSVVVVGDQADLRCIDVLTGDILWRRTDIAPHHNLVNHSSPLITAGRVFIGYWPVPTSPVGLSLRDGSGLWDNPSDGVPAEPESQNPPLVMGTASHDELSDLILMPAYSETIALDPASGAVRWRTGHPGRFSPSAPLPTEKGILTTVAGHGLRMLNPVTGGLLWEAHVDSRSPFPMQPYSKEHAPVLAGPTLAGEHILLPCLDGKIRTFSFSGQLVSEVNVGMPIAAPLVHHGESLLGFSLTGHLFSTEMKGLIS